MHYVAKQNCLCYLFYFFVLGTVVGIIWVNMDMMHWLNEKGILSGDMLLWLSRTTPDTKQLCSYLLRQRLRVAALLIGLAFTSVGVIMTYGIAVVYGCSFGCITTVAVIRYGIKGIVFMILACTPQILVLLPALLLLANESIKMHNQVYGIQRNGLCTEKERCRFWLKELCIVILLIVVVIMACLLESYVNQIVLNYALKKFS